MKIIIVGAQYIGSITGGGGIHVAELTRELAKLKHDVLVLSMGLQNSPALEEINLDDPYNSDENLRTGKVKVKRFFPPDAKNIFSPFAGSKEEEINRLEYFKQQVLKYLLEHNGD